MTAPTQADSLDWRAYPQGKSWRVTSRGALLTSHLSKRDAFLIAAAPAMAAALERVAQFLSYSLEGGDHYDPTANELEHVKAALRLATKGPTP